MSGPPEHIEASDLFVLLQAMPRPHRVVDFPRLGPGGMPVGKVAIWPLTQTEQVAANIEAERYAKNYLKDGKRGDIGYESAFNNEGAVQTLYRACRDPNSPKLSKAAFPSPAAMRETLTADEIGVLFANYMTVQLEVGPIIANLTKDEEDAWIRRLSEGGARFLANSLSSELKTDLLISMASRLATSMTDTSFAGSPPDATAANEMVT